MSSPVTKPVAQTVFFARGAYVSGQHCPTGTVKTVSGADWSLLRESGRAIPFDASNPGHVLALDSQKKAESAAAKTARAEEEKAEADAIAAEKQRVETAAKKK